MGVNDAAEMLEAAKADAILMERKIADLQGRLDEIRALAEDPRAYVDPHDGLAIPDDVVRADDLLRILDRPPVDVHGVFVRDHDAHEIAHTLRAGQGDVELSPHGEDVVTRLEQA